MRRTPRLPTARPPGTARVALAALLAVSALAITACNGGDRRDGAPLSDAPSAPPPTDARATSSNAEPLLVAIDVSDAGEAATLGARLTEVGFRVDPSAPTRVTEATRHDVAAPRDARVVVDAFTLVVHPRFGVYDLSLEEATAILEGTSDLGRQLLVAEEAAHWLRRAHPAPSRLDRTVEAGALIAEVAAAPGLVGLIPVSALNPEVRALTIDGHDPYRDPWTDSPLADGRTVAGPHADATLDALGWNEDALADPIGFVATGELIPARCVTDRVSALPEGYDTIFEGTRDLLGAADLAMAHWEPAIVDDTPTPCTPTFNLSTVPEAAHATARAGIDVALAVGNHVGDCWTGCSYTSAVQQTVAFLREAGLAVAGAGANVTEAREPVLVTVDGVTFAFLGYDAIAWQHYGARADSAGTAHADLEGIAADVRAAAAQADHVVVGFSWGVEYVAEPTPWERERARTAIEAGASLVVGNHPHWVQATEWIDGGFVAYSLGNFVFDQDWSIETTQGALLEVGFTPERIIGVRIRPTAIRQQHAVELLPPTEGEGMAILDRIWRATDTIAP